MAPPNFQATYSRRVILACRLIAGTLLAGCVSVLTGFVDMKVYSSDVEYARETPDRGRFKSHRCNDRLADWLEVIEAEDAHTWRDFRPAFRNWWACMRSPEGQEPAMPYLMLKPMDKQYISPEQRAVLAELRRDEQQGSGHAAAGGAAGAS